MTSRVIQVAQQKLQDIDEPYPGYRRQILDKLVFIIQVQQDGASRAARQREIWDVIRNFGQKLTSKTQEGKS